MKIGIGLGEIGLIQIDFTILKKTIFNNVVKGGGFIKFDRLKDLREDRDLLQKDIGEVLGIKQTVYSRYERGYQNIPIEHLLVLADFYNTSVDYILGRTNEIRPYGKIRKI